VNVIGLDLSTARIGFAAADGELVSIVARAKADDPYRRLHELARSVELELARRPPRPDLAVIEDYSLGGPGRISMIRLGEIGGVVRTRLFELDIPMVLVRPSTLKRFATGRGDADKPAMVAAAVARGATPRNDDEADAFHARRMGRAALGLEGKLADHELDAVSVVTW
jgi:Holliday junction resolvasome RuvABC endonuclease subunit